MAFKYLPDYLLNSKYRDTITENAADIARGILVGDKVEVIDTDIIVDGGNVIKCDNAVIMVDKVIRANPHYSASKLLAELTRLFDCEVFLIPWDDEEGMYGHSDCYRRLGHRDMCPHRMDADKERQERDGGPYAHGKQECCPEGNPQQVGRPCRV